MNLLLDMNIPFKYAALLKKKDIEVLRWPDVGAPDAADMEIMEYARNNGFIVLTFDLDFSAILSLDLKKARVRLLPL
jgi:predicted nuclease of predicted toxin-antitoxin system